MNILQVLYFVHFVVLVAIISYPFLFKSNKYDVYFLCCFTMLFMHWILIGECILTVIEKHFEIHYPHKKNSKVVFNYKYKNIIQVIHRCVVVYIAALVVYRNNWCWFPDPFKHIYIGMLVLYFAFNPLRNFS
jgi:hypothetical protein